MIIFCFDFLSILAPFWGPSWGHVGDQDGPKTPPGRPRRPPGRRPKRRLYFKRPQEASRASRPPPGDFWYLFGICLVSVWYPFGICLVGLWYDTKQIPNRYQRDTKEIPNRQRRRTDRRADGQTDRQIIASSLSLLARWRGRSSAALLDNIIIS